jgi:hypothetical protein
VEEDGKAVLMATFIMVGFIFVLHLFLCGANGS